MLLVLGVKNQKTFYANSPANIKGPLAQNHIKLTLPLYFARVSSKIGKKVEKRNTNWLQYVFSYTEDNNMIVNA